MQIKRVKCPKCNLVLDVKNSQNETVKRIVCPQCRAELQVKFEPQQQPMEARTYYAPRPQQVAYGETQLGGFSSGETKLSLPEGKGEKMAKLVCGERDYALKEGVNIVGRCATKTEATVQIATDDSYMSRMHVRIEVRKLSGGGQKVVLSNYKNRNQTCINNHLIETGDEIRLADGDQIKMGKTIITFKIS